MARTYDVPETLSTVDFRLAPGNNSRLADLGFSLDDLRGAGLDELARRGAKLILETALRGEVLDLLGRDCYERGGGSGP